jgi:hypothetical protein
MSTEIATLETTNYDALDANIGSDLDGEPLRFKDGKFFQGFDKIEVEDGTVLRAAPPSIQDGFVRWENGKPVDWRMREWINPNQLPVYRDTLGDTDESKSVRPQNRWAMCALSASMPSPPTWARSTAIAQLTCVPCSSPLPTSPRRIGLPSSA